MIFVLDGVKIDTFGNCSIQSAVLWLLRVETVKYSLPNSFTIYKILQEELLYFYWVMFVYISLYCFENKMTCVSE